MSRMHALAQPMLQRRGTKTASTLMTEPNTRPRFPAGLHPGRHAHAKRGVGLAIAAGPWSSDPSSSEQEL